MRWRDRRRDDEHSRLRVDVCMHVQDRQFPSVAVNDRGADRLGAVFGGLSFGQREEDQGLGCGDGFRTAYKPRKPFVARRGERSPGFARDEGGQARNAGRIV